MRRIRIRRQERDWLGIATATGLGLTAGVLAGIVTGELLGAVNLDGVRETMGRGRRARADAEGERVLMHAVATALAEHPTTRTLGLAVEALGGDVVELRGSVADAADRDLASRVARGAAPEALIVNRVLVEEGDLPAEPVASSVG